ncbi:type IV secretion system protein [Legionella impletisoli]|uniref:Vir protein B5 n=1 Tax=Legionella impletisoli TaxID=343510 RepID=A0A917JS54_9GAMM|nr:type IV secretion system protein [Legionella impletisoli]GGI82594.1 hypothetical protein GCM10007966_09030 [Legionella impletisoli]
MIRRTCLLLILGLLASPSYADLLGVEDAALLAKTIEQLQVLKNQYNTLKRTYENSSAQLNAIKEMKKQNKGHYGFGDLNNGLDTLQSWQSPASTWSDALRNLSGGNPSRYQALVEAYEKNHPALDENQYAQNTTPAQTARFKEDKAVNRAVLVQTTDSYNEINRRMKVLHDLSKQIEKTDNTKGAIDLNSRLITELAFIQLMSLRLQTLMNQQVAQESLAELQDRAEMAKFNCLTSK